MQDCTGMGEMGNGDISEEFIIYVFIRRKETLNYA
jgi:hypothetical protein